MLRFKFLRFLQNAKQDADRSTVMSSFLQSFQANSELYQIRPRLFITSPQDLPDTY
jgi:hypothetical protein